MDSLSKVVGQMIDSVSAAEKHMLARQPSVFLHEYQGLADNLKQNLRKVLQDLETRQEPKRSAFPRPDEITKVRDAIELIRLNETQQIVEQVGLNSKQMVQCKDCG